MGIAPQTPDPPSRTFFSSLAGAAASPLYRWAISWNEGPTSLRSTAWQPIQAFERAIASPSAAANARTGITATSPAATTPKAPTQNRPPKPIARATLIKAPSHYPPARQQAQPKNHR